MLAFTVAIIFFAAIFLVAFLSVLIATQLMERQTRVEEEQTAEGVDGSATILREDRVSSISPFALVLQKLDIIPRVQQATMQAGLEWPVGRTVAMMLLCGTLTFAILSTDWMPSILLFAIAGGASAFPYMYILRKRRKRFEAFEQQFPEAIDSLCRALKAGHPFAAGMEVVANEPYQPVSSELKKALDEWKLGSTWLQALENLSARVPLTDVQIFVSAVKLHMRTGGRLGEVLGRLAETMRENAAIRGEVRALAAHGRLTGNILSVLPLVLAGVLLFVNPSQMLLLVTHPWGQNMIVAGAVSLLLAHIVIRKIVDIKQ